MALGGGKFMAMDKVIPGAYTNTVAATTGLAPASRGTATLPLELNWGPDGQVVSLTRDEYRDNALSLLGYEAGAPELLLVTEALKRALVLKLYRINGGGEKAKKTIGGVEWTARYSGTRGNELKGAVQQNIDDEHKFDVITYLGQKEVDRQTVATAAELVANGFVAFGAGTLTVEAAMALSGGTNGSTDGNAYTKYLQAAEVESFDAIGYPGNDATTAKMFAAFAIRLNEEEGKKVQCVIPGGAYDHEAILNVKNGVVLADGTTLPKEKAAVWVTGATAGARYNQSLTNAAYEGAVDVDAKYKKGEYVAAIKAGEFVFYAEAGQARVLSDINSLVTFTKEKPEAMASNRVMRVLNSWANDVARIFADSVLGVGDNNEIGRDLFKADLVTLSGIYQDDNAIEDFVPEDIQIEKGPGKKTIVVRNGLQPVDSPEILYMTTEVR